MSFHSEVVPFANNIGDGDMAYEVIVDPRPLGAYPGSAQLADVYVQLPSHGNSASIHVYSEGHWIPWDPANPLSLICMDVPIHSSPCAMEGFTYVSTRDEVANRSENAPADVQTLATLVATTVGFPVVPHQQEGTSNDVGEAAPEGRRQSGRTGRQTASVKKGKEKQKQTQTQKQKQKQKQDIPKAGQGKAGTNPSSPPSSPSHRPIPYSSALHSGAVLALALAIQPGSFIVPGLQQIICDIESSIPSPSSDISYYLSSH